MDKVKIIICKTCRGNGTIETATLIDYHHNTYDYRTKDCFQCKGSGRMKKTKTITLEPHAL